MHIIRNIPLYEKRHLKTVGDFIFLKRCGSGERFLHKDNFYYYVRNNIPGIVYIQLIGIEFDNSIWIDDIVNSSSEFMHGIGQKLAEKNKKLIFASENSILSNTFFNHSYNEIELLYHQIYNIAIHKHIVINNRTILSEYVSLFQFTNNTR